MVAKPLCPLYKNIIKPLDRARYPELRYFVRSRYSNQSTKYSEEKLLAKIKEYLQENRYITTRILRILFGLTPYMAQKWLNHFCEKGIMEKEGTQHAPIYFLK